MTIIEALRESHKVRRDIWIKDSFIFWEERKWVDNRNVAFYMSPNALLATDWQPYEPEKVKCEACKEAEAIEKVSITEGAFVLMSDHLRQFHCQCSK